MEYRCEVDANRVLTSDTHWQKVEADTGREPGKNDHRKTRNSYATKKWHHVFNIVHLNTKNGTQCSCIPNKLFFWSNLILNYFVWLRIADEGSVPEMRIWSILLIKSDLKWCIHLSRSLFLYFKIHCTWRLINPVALLFPVDESENSVRILGYGDRLISR